MAYSKRKLKEDNTSFADSDLREITKQWGGEAWEYYLASTVDVPLKESLLEKSDGIESIPQGYREAYQNMLQQDELPQVKAVIRVLLQHLSLREQRVVYGAFWEGKSLRDIAQEMKISKSTAANYKVRALEKLGKLLLKKISLEALQEKKFSESCPSFVGQNPLG